MDLLRDRIYTKFEMVGVVKILKEKQCKMFTILLAWIMAKYRYSFGDLFFATVIMDIMLIISFVITIEEIFT